MLMNNTSHLTMNEFVYAFESARPGDRILYATGDLAFSAQYSAELSGLRRLIWQKYHESGLVCLTQQPCEKARFRGGRAFQYFATKREP